MIYGREQFGGLGEAASVGAAVLRLLPPTTTPVNDRRAEFVTSSTIAGESPFNDTPATQESYLFDTNPDTSNAWWRSETNTETQGFVALAGGINPVQCSAVRAVLLRLYAAFFPVPRFFISDGPEANGSEVSLKVYKAVEACHGTQQRSNVNQSVFCRTAAQFPQYVGWQDQFLEPPENPSIAVTTFTNLFRTGLGRFYRYVLKNNTSTTSSLWQNGIEERGLEEVYGLEGSLVIELQNPSFTARMPDDVQRVLNLNDYGSFFVVGEGAVTSDSLNVRYEPDCYLYCSPYTGKGYLHVGRVRPYSNYESYDGVTYTFDHNLAARPSVPNGEEKIADRYFAGVALDQPATLPSPLVLNANALNGDAVRLSVFTVPRVLESTAPPVLPTATGLVDAEQAMFLGYTGSPANVLYLDGYTQQQALADKLSQEPFGNQWASNDAGNGNVKRPNYITDFAGVTYFTGQSRHNTLPSSTDWSGLNVTFGQTAGEFFPGPEENGVFYGPVSPAAIGAPNLGITTDGTKMPEDAFALLQCVLGTHQLTAYRDDGVYIGNNKYTTGNTEPGHVVQFDNTTTAVDAPFFGGSLYVPLDPSAVPPGEMFSYWIGNQSLNQFPATNLSERHVIVSTPTFDPTGLPRLSDGAPEGSGLTQEQIYLGLFGLGSARSPTKSAALGLNPSTDLAYDVRDPNEASPVFRYYRIINAFPFATNPYVGWLGGIGSRTNLHVTDLCVYAELLLPRNYQFSEAIGRPLLTVRLCVGAHVRVDSVFARANVYELVRNGQSYEPGSVIRTIDHDGLTTSTTNFTGFESFIELSREESDSLIEGQPVAFDLKPVATAFGTFRFSRQGDGDLTASFPVTITPVLAAA